MITAPIIIKCIILINTLGVAFRSSINPVVIAYHPRFNRFISTSTSFDTINNNRLFAGYVPPERDPEYRNVVPKSSVTIRKTSTKSLPAGDNVDQSIDDDSSKNLPIPKEGDIVKYSGRWGDIQVGRVRFLQYVDNYNEWFADIVPLKEGKSENIFTIDRNSKAEYLSISDLSPVKNAFMRNENGYKLYFEKKNKQIDDNNNSNNNKEKAAYSKINNVVLRSEKYNIDIPKDYNIRSKTLDYQKLESDMEDYEKLKIRIILSTLKYGLASAVLVTAGFGLDISLYYTLGVFGGAIYLFLLGKNIDYIGKEYSAIKQPIINDPTVNMTITTTTSVSTPISLQQCLSPKDKLIKSIAKGRLLIPFFVILLITYKSTFIDNNGKSLHDIEYFKFITQKQFISSMSGFLSIRLSLFISEVTKEIRSDDWLSFVPGSVAEGVRRYKDKSKEDSIAADEIIPLEPLNVMFVTGPVAAGRNSLMTSFLDTSSNEQTFQKLKLLTTDVSYASIESKQASEWYEYVSLDEMMKLRLSNELVFEGVDRDSTGRMINVALSRASLITMQEKLSSLQTSNNNNPIPFFNNNKQSPAKYCIVNGPPQLLDVLI
eukprot:gene10868-14586_t